MLRAQNIIPALRGRAATVTTVRVRGGKDGRTGRPVSDSSPSSS